MEGKVGGGVGGEIRRVHIIYFLSRMGRVEHPHLIRVHHLSKNGVHLRDVKRWLSELRGKDMPDSFAWSYKRRYKTGYVWQDLLDDDLISPISDNEYVIKGSEITTLSFDPCFHGEKKGSTLAKAETITSIEEIKSKIPDSKSSNGGESQFDGEDSGPLDSETSTESSESIKERNSDDDHQKQRSIVPITEIKELNDETENSLQKNDKNEITEKQNPSSSSSTTSTARSSSSSSSSSSFNKSKSYSSGGATNVFRSLLSCRATDINDSALMMIRRSSCSSSSEICKFENLGGSDTNTSGILWNQHQSRQCGKGFKPERLHSHMKSCRGLKSLSKNRNSATAGYDCETEQKFTTFGSFKERNQQGCF
ncbi:protein UPSTREAM OF FLC-like isoform X2 [Papaver somniferum]|uniref:protein UPSTREAM OF FLC-like isoform X2 n=1 Tax=Papaver somniferum TaxID=3469 RepID=UPI000E6F8A3B|nr:protein UPSTREAM OF FLC-like isoform X2 [Papaver somniferum]